MHGKLKRGASKRNYAFCTSERVEIGLKGQPPAFSEVLEVLSGETERTITLKNVQQADWIRLDAHCQPAQEGVIEAFTASPVKELTADRLVIFHTRLAGGGADFGRYSDAP